MKVRTVNVLIASSVVLLFAGFTNFLGISDFARGLSNDHNEVDADKKTYSARSKSVTAIETSYKPSKDTQADKTTEASKDSKNDSDKHRQSASRNLSHGKEKITSDEFLKYSDKVSHARSKTSLVKQLLDLKQQTRSRS